MSADPDIRWRVYLLAAERPNGKRLLYTGITSNVEKRVEQHAAGKGARCLRGLKVLGIVWHSPRMRKGDALRAEAAVKRLTPADKHDFALVSNLVRSFST